MRVRTKRILVGAAIVVPLLLVSARAAQRVRQHRALEQLDALVQQGAQEHQHHVAPGATHDHQHMDAHMKWTAPRPQTPDDKARAAEIVTTLRGALEKYRDSRAAVEDGYLPFHPEFPQRMYHFTSNARGALAAFRFDAAKPTSLLYKKTDRGFELIGAMYTAPRNFSEERLDARVPLSVARWHQHVNLCLPPRGTDPKSADWTRFGPAGAIATREQCEEAGGRFVPRIFGWMVHVYPFEPRSERIWTH